MRKSFFAVVLLHCLTAATAQQPYSKAVNEQIARVENNLSGGIVIDGKPYHLYERMKHYNVTGLSMAVVKNYKIVWAKGYGWADKKEKCPVTITTLFRPGSISKSLNAVGVLKLAQDNKLDIYKDINDYLTLWKFPYDSLSKGKKITTANLLTIRLVYLFMVVSPAMVQKVKFLRYHKFWMGYHPQTHQQFVHYLNPDWNFNIQVAE